MIILSGLISGLVSMINSNDPLKAFEMGFVAGAGTAAAGLAGPVAGAIVGGLLSVVMAYVSGDRRASLGAAFAFGAIAGGVGGAMDPGNCLGGVFNMVDKLTAEIYGYQVCVGVIAGDGQSVASQASR